MSYFNMTQRKSCNGPNNKSFDDLKLGKGQRCFGTKMDFLMQQNFT